MMGRRILAARVLWGDGVLLIVVGLIHLLISARLMRFIEAHLTPQSMPYVSPPFVLNHIVVGVLLIAIGLTTMYCAGGVRNGQRWGRDIALFNALAILSFPLLLARIMPPELFHAWPFVIASLLVTTVAISMMLPLWLSKREPRD